MNAEEFNNYLKILGLSQGAAAAHLQVAPRTVRRWQSGEQEVPPQVESLLKAWHQLDKARIPWSADLESFWLKDTNQIRRHQDHALALAALLERVKSRGGVSAPWRISLEDHEAMLEVMTVRFYQLANGGFSLANYRRSDKPPDINRDWPLIEDAVAAFAAALGESRNNTTNLQKGDLMSKISNLPIGSKILIQSADPSDRRWAEWHGYVVESAITHGPITMRRDYPSGAMAAGYNEPAAPRFSVEIL